MTDKGVILDSTHGILHINFEDCAKNFSLAKGVDFSKCVAIRDINQLSYTFFTQDTTTVVFKRKSIFQLLIRKSATNEFFDLQNAIIKAGYTSYDLS